MNKQELIEKIDNLQYSLSWNIPRINKEIVLDLIEQLDQPQKPVVPQFVADWYEKNKDSFDYNLWQYLTEWEEIEPSDFKNWINEECNIFQTLVNMHQFGYTVVKEKRYLVKLKGINSESEYLYYGIGSCTWRFREKNESGYFRKSHTRKELEDAGFGDVFNSQLFEVEEVK
nr:MAG TPA: Protein of unknown function (DUF1642) [Caudoviricetes sp.]